MNERYIREDSEKGEFYLRGPYTDVQGAIYALKRVATERGTTETLVTGRNVEVKASSESDTTPLVRDWALADMGLIDPPEVGPTAQAEYSPEELAAFRATWEVKEEERRRSGWGKTLAEMYRDYMRDERGVHSVEWSSLGIAMGVLYPDESNPLYRRK